MYEYIKSIEPNSQFTIHLLQNYPTKIKKYSEKSNFKSINKKKTTDIITTSGSTHFLEIVQ